jgi:hypothetical protein
MTKPIEPECSKCRHLTDCKEVTEQKIIKHHSCSLYKQADIAELAARFDIERELGPWALRYELPITKKRSARPNPRRRKRHV